MQEAASLDEGTEKVINALARKSELKLTGVFASARNDDFFFVVGKVRGLYRANSDRHCPVIPSKPERSRCEATTTQPGGKPCVQTPSKTSGNRTQRFHED
jgi:hypothetical protein